MNWLMLAHGVNTVPWGMIVVVAIAILAPLTILAAAIAPAMARRLRFSFRTMLIATTLVAVVLGLAVYAATK